MRTDARTTIAQLAMFDAVNAVLDDSSRPLCLEAGFGARCVTEAAAIRAAYIVALNEVPTQVTTIDSAYAASIATVPASPEAIADGIIVGEAAANGVLAARLGRSPYRSRPRGVHAGQWRWRVDPDSTCIREPADSVPSLRHALRV